MEVLHGYIFPGITSWLASWWFAAAAALALCTVLLAIATLVLRRPKLPRNAPTLITGWPIFGSVGFYLWRHNFLQVQRKKHGEQPYSFYYGRYPIVRLAGAAGRALLFNSRQLDLHAGYSTLLAVLPEHETESANSVRRQIKLFRKILTRERLAESLPSIVTDTDSAFRKLSSSDKAVPILPFMCRLVYRLMHRVGGVHEFAESDKLLDSTLKHFHTIETCSALQIMFNPWPLPGMLSKLWAGFSLHRAMVRVMDERHRTGRVEGDALQLLMDYGEAELEIVKCIIGVLFSGLLNTGISSTWLLCYLAENQVWYKKVQAEVDAFINKNRTTPSESVHEILQRVPYNDWDTQFPIISICLRETLRVGVYHPTLRRNISGEDLAIPGTNQVIPNKSFAFYSMGEVHMDERIYPNASRWEPARHLPGREEGADKPHEFLGWGSGLHPCVGSKAATLEITVAIVTMVAHNEFQLVERNGKPRKRPLPNPNMNNLSVNLPSEEIYFKCSPRADKTHKQWEATAKDTQFTFV